MTRALPIIAAVLAAVVFHSIRVEAHKPITSKYTYTEDVFPIVNARCGGCHAAGGVAPMSLLSYKEAFPWAESIRVELLANHMPPSFEEPGYGDIRRPTRLSPRELDVLLTWVTGGTPEGPAKRLSASPLKNEWKIGKPDLVFQMPAPFIVAADTMEATQEFVLTSTTADRWIRAADVLPGTPAIVRNAVVFSRSAADEEPNVLALWNPGDPPANPPGGSAFRWPAGSELVLRVHYLKTWTYDGKAVSDRSSVGVYLANGTLDKEIRSVSINGNAYTLEQDTQAVAIRIEAKEADKKLKLEAIRPDGTRIPMISLLTRPTWNRRYWFSRPVALPRGTRINIAGNSTAHVWLEVAASRS